MGGLIDGVPDFSSLISPGALSSRHLPLIRPINTPRQHSAVVGCWSGRDKDKKRSGKRIEGREKGGEET